MVTQPRRRRLLALTATFATLLSSLALWAVPAAQADTAPAAGTPATVASDSLPAPQVNGVVWTQTVIGNTVYAGGNFTQAQPAGAAAGVGTVSRSALLAYNLTSGALVTTFAPSFNGQVRGLAASADGTTLYVVGDFTTVSGTSHAHVVALNATTGAVKAAFTAQTNSSAYAVAVSGTTVYLGGGFTTADNAARTRAAAVDGTTGALTAWAPSIPDHAVRAIVISPDGSKVVLGGSFSSVNGGTSPGRGLASIDARTGTTNLAWAVGNLIYDHGDNASVYSLWSDGTNVYGTGYVFGSLTDGNLEGTFNASWNGGTINWIEDCHGDSYSVATLGAAVYTVSHAHYCGNLPNGFAQTDPNPSNAKKQHALAFSEATTGTLAHDPYGAPYADFYGQPAPSLLTWYPDLGLGTFTGQAQAAWSVTTSSKGYVLLGGEFPTVNGQRQVGLARFAVSTIAPDKDGPQLSGTNFSSGTNWKPTAVSLQAGSTRVSWPANWDRDNANLTYTVYRNGGSTPVFTKTVESEGFWLRPTLGFVDTGLTPGSSVSYKVIATDPFGNAATSATATTTVSGGTVSSTYSNDVIKDGAIDFWRLGETTGSSVYDWAGYNDMTAGSGVAFGTPGAISGDANTAASFDGDVSANGLAATRTAVPGPSTFTIETWFRTTSTTGGKIVGFGDQSSGNSSSYDRHVYMDGSGAVYFGVYPGHTATVQSAAGYNDGKWHQAVAALSSAGMQLYLDGKQVASRTDVTSAQAYNGYWRIGGDTSWTGANYFAGDIDDTAIYPTALSAASVTRHWNDAGHGALVASFTANSSALTATVDGSGSSDGGGTITGYAWNFGDGASLTGASANHTYATAGTYTVSLTVTDSLGATSSTAKQVTVTAPPSVHLASDGFGRTVTAGLGTADVGGPWSLAGGSSNFSVGNGAGSFSDPKGQTLAAYLNSATSTASDVQVSFGIPAMPAGGSLYAGIVGRRVGNDDYDARLIVAPTGSVSIQVLHGGTALKSASITGLTLVSGSVIHLRLQTTGSGTTTIQARAWLDKTAEPSTWQVTATDTTAPMQASGSVGLRTYAASGITNNPITVTVSGFLADPVH